MFRDSISLSTPHNFRNTERSESAALLKSILALLYMGFQCSSFINIISSEGGFAAKDYVEIFQHTTQSTHHSSTFPIHSIASTFLPHIRTLPWAPATSLPQQHHYGSSQHQQPVSPLVSLVGLPHTFSWSAGPFSLRPLPYPL